MVETHNIPSVIHMKIKEFWACYGLGVYVLSWSVQMIAETVFTANSCKDQLQNGSIYNAYNKTQSSLLCHMVRTFEIDEVTFVFRSRRWFSIFCLQSSASKLAASALIFRLIETSFRAFKAADIAPSSTQATAMSWVAWAQRHRRSNRTAASSGMLCVDMAEKITVGPAYAANACTCQDLCERYWQGSDMITSGASCKRQSLNCNCTSLMSSNIDKQVKQTYLFIQVARWQHWHSICKKGMWALKFTS